MALDQKTKIALDTIFNPKSIVVAGVSPTINWGALFWQALRDYGYSGDLYAVGLGGGEIRGEKIYDSIKEVPDNIDLVICAIPKKYTLQLVDDCGQKGVKSIHFFTAGFAEVEDKIGEDLEKELLKTARKHGMRIIGPNCIGVYCPRSTVSMSGKFSTVPGSVAYLAQSGGQCGRGIKEANSRGIFFSKAISYGNAADINECDLIEYLTEDPETKIITAYIEGTRDGRRLFRALNEATRKKPVIFYKGGTTESGAKATLSHTSSIAGSNTAWDTLIKQTGVIRVDTIEEMYDVVTVLQYCPEPRGLRTLVLGQGGGASVQAADEVCRAGLNMPLLTDKLRETLVKVHGSDTGYIFKNPLDISLRGNDPSLFADIINWDGIDLILMHAAPESSPFHSPTGAINESINNSILFQRSVTKPIVSAVNFNTVEAEEGLHKLYWDRMVQSGMALFPSAYRAAIAVVLVYKYYQWLHTHS